MVSNVCIYIRKLSNLMLRFFEVFKIKIFDFISEILKKHFSGKSYRKNVTCDSFCYINENLEMPTSTGF